MGGRYGGTTDGSSGAPSRRPEGSSGDSDQQTIAEAVRSVRQRQSKSGQRDGSSAGGGSWPDPSTAQPSIDLTAATSKIIGSTLSVDERIADVVASSIVDQIKNADEDVLEDDSEWWL
ncbi:hypothetical protein [Halocatena halophila]|uniref:hypothetical protein n=1 Tax=Halocatena halophila TaxID=2814576 RepID=UPI002ED07B08